MSFFTSIVVEVPEPVGDESLDRMTELPYTKKLGSSVTLTMQGQRLEWSFQFDGDLENETSQAMPLIGDSLDVVQTALSSENITDWILTRVAMLSMEELRREARKTAPVVGIAEASDLLGVSRKRVYQLIDDGRFPKELAELRSGRLWDRQEVLEFAGQERKPGRPRREVVDGGTMEQA